MTELELGTKVYWVNSVYNSIGKNKVTMTDQNGDVWGRYDHPKLEHHLYEGTIVAIHSHIIKGTIPKNGDIKLFGEPEIDTEYYITYTDCYGLSDTTTRYEYEFGKSVHINKNIALEEMKSKERSS